MQNKAVRPYFLLALLAGALVLAFFILTSIYFVASGKKLHAFLSILAGTLIKYIPLISFPWLLWKIYSKSTNIKNYVLYIFTVALLFTIIFSTTGISVPFVSGGSTQTQFQPWYLFWTLPLVALVSSPLLAVMSVVVSYSVMLRYLPYLYTGVWSEPGTTQFMSAVLWLPLVIFIIIYFAWKIIKKI